MKYINYQDMAGAILNKETFEGNSVSASVNSEGFYSIKSWNTVICIVTPDNQVIFCNKRYSVTTSKLQNLIIDILGLSDSKKR